MTVAPLNRTLDQELASLARGVSLECLVCGEFLLRANGHAGVPGVSLDPRRGSRNPEYELPSVVQAG